VEIAIQLIEENAYNGQFSTKEQERTPVDRLHVPHYYGANHSSEKVRVCARELLLCIQRQSSFERPTEIDRDT
jgi:hypothetical protein